MLAPFTKRGHFEYKKWDAHAQALIANISGLPEKTVGATDEEHWADGDLFRLVVLHNYGGVYLDCDTLLLRDYGPLVGDEFAYVWGTHCDGSNGAVMRMFKGSALAKQMLATLVETPFRKRSLDWGFFLYVKVNKVMPFLRMPTCFFNANWLTPGPGWKGGPPYAPFRVAHRPFGDEHARGALLDPHARGHLLRRSAYRKEATTCTRRRSSARHWCEITPSSRPRSAL